MFRNYFFQSVLPNYFKTKRIVFTVALILLGVVFLFSCQPKKKTRFSIALHNLTSEYNILFHGNEDLKEVIEDVELSYQDDFSKFLPVFREPSSSSSAPFIPKLDKCINRANTVINFKTYTTYTDQAYLLLGKANYWSANFYTAIEYFNYLQKHYPKSKDIVHESLVWESRALININRRDEATDTLALALKLAKGNMKARLLSEIYATLGDLYIKQGKYYDASDCMKTAIRNNWFDPQRKFRWKYILAQLQEQVKDTAGALSNYTSVARNNVAFEMAFNADLQKMKLQEYYRPQNEKLKFRVKRLKRMLKDEKNADFKDQIHYQIGLVYMDNNLLAEGMKCFEKSIRESSVNVKQKGIGYLTLADIYFDKLYDYANAGKYYDSALVCLPKDFPNYAVLEKKSRNLKPLSNLKDSISRLEAFLNISQLSPLEREAKINLLVEEELKLKKSPKNESKIYSDVSSSLKGTKTFYFYNPEIIAEGAEAFKAKWGNRKLEDNWRRSNRSLIDILSGNSSQENSPPNKKPDEGRVVLHSEEKLRAKYKELIPDTKEKQEKVHETLEILYLKVANFHRDVLEDKQGAMKAYDLFIYKFPKSEHCPEAYYNLYRLYSNRDANKANYYRSLLVNVHPNSKFTKIILDPDYNKKKDSYTDHATKAYTDARELYLQKRYSDAERILTNTSKQTEYIASLPLKFYYLYSLCYGHSQPTDSLVTYWNHLKNKFPKDTVIIPLINKHLETIAKNKEYFAKRPFALMDSYPVFSDDPFFPKYESAKTLTSNTASGTVSPTLQAPPINTFHFPDSASFSFGIYMRNSDINASAVRTKIGQFNRINYARSNFKHDIKAIDDEHQLVFVNDIGDLSEAVEYYDRIIRYLQKELKYKPEQVIPLVISDIDFEGLSTIDQLDKFVLYFQKYF